MKKIITLSLIFFNLTALLADDIDSKYLAGAVPLDNGKVKFVRTIELNENVPVSQLYDLVKNWVKTEYISTNTERKTESRILLEQEAEKYIVVQADDRLIFKTGLLIYDYSVLGYQLIARASKGMVELEFRNLRYLYRDDDIMTAETMITDEVALNKDKTKLKSYYDKFRTFTINRVDEVRESLLASLGQVSMKEIKVEAVVPSIVDVSVIKTSTPSIDTTPAKETETIKVIREPVIGVAQMVGYKRIEINQLPDYIKAMMEKENWTLVKSSRNLHKDAAESAWAGFGELFGKKTVTSVVKADDTTITSIGENGDYTIFFFTEKDKTEGLKNVDDIIDYKKAWLMIECKKMMDNSISKEFVKEVNLPSDWDSNENYKIYIGEIVNTWLKQ